MRISDWSSDVCSSDLVMAGPGGRMGRRCMDLQRADIERLGGVIVDGRGRQHERPARRILLIAGDGGLRRELANDVAGVAVANRSEEHTSELQSLMRISYAVFCFKKKKKLQ